MDEGVNSFKVKVEDSRRESAGTNSTPKTEEDVAENAKVTAGGDDVDSSHGAFRRGNES